jgi:hypothetical protein
VVIYGLLVALWQTKYFVCKVDLAAECKLEAKPNEERLAECEWDFTPFALQAMYIESPCRQHLSCIEIVWRALQNPILPVELEEVSGRVRQVFLSFHSAHPAF